MRVAHRRPSSRPPSNDGATEHSQGSGSRTKFRTKTILVVDDHEDNRELFAMILREEGFVVSVASDGIEGLAIAALERPEVILMDLAMPGMDGFQTIERLRSDERTRDAYILVISAFSDRTSRMRAREVGADGFLEKPCAPHVLRAAIETAFATVESPRAAAG